MMTPSQHYAMAEEVLRVREEWRRGCRSSEITLAIIAIDANFLAKAQVHATLATVDGTRLP